MAATVLFAVQLYMDFSGCCDIALGAARILGYDLIENFQSPFEARTFNDFWRRWHISMTSWFRDYVYFSLGGSRLPVLMLTARSELNDRVRGLDAGADYYLTKPFEPEELLACIRSLLRRGGEDAAADPEVTAFGDLTLHMGTFLLECGPRSVRLSRREYDLMELLMRNGSQIVSKEQLILKVWGYDSAAEDNNVEVYISFLRRKLTHLQSTVKIKTLRMVGYCLEVEA